MKKLMTLFLVIILVVITVTGCTQSQSKPVDSDEKTPNAGEPEYELIFSTVYDYNQYMVRCIEKFVEDVGEKSNGRIKINFFHTAQLGSEVDTNTALAAGEIDFVMQGLMSQYLKEFNFLTTPFMIKDFDHFQALIDGKIGDIMRDKLLDNNVHLLGFGSRGPRHIATNIEVNSAKDFEGLRIRIPQLAHWITVFNAIGFEPVAVDAGELYTSLQTGLVQGAEGPYDQMKAMNYNEVCDYIIEVAHEYDVAQLSINEKLWQSLPTDLQDIIADCAEDCLNSITEESEIRNADAKNFLLNNNMTEVIFTKEDVQYMSNKARETYDDYFAKDWNITSYEEVMSYAE